MKDSDASTGRGTRYPHVEAILRKYYAQNRGKVLEIGAGGAVYKDIFTNYVGTDLPGTVYATKGDLSVFCDAQYLPFKEDTFDMAFVVAALYQIKDTALVLSEIKRVLKPNGHFLMFDYNKKTTTRLKVVEKEGNNFDHVWSPWELRRIVRKAGFQAEIVVPATVIETKKKLISWLISKIPGSILYLVSNWLWEGWSIIAATKRKRSE